MYYEKLCARKNVACAYAWLEEGGGVYIVSSRNAVIGLDCALKRAIRKTADGEDFVVEKDGCCPSDASV